jgi:lysophospholipase L1-like esterase
MVIAGVILGDMCCMPGIASDSGSPRAGGTVNMVFIGDSITEGDYLREAPPASTIDWLRPRVPDVTLFFSNQGKSGHTTVDASPATGTDFPEIEKAATQLQAAHEGRLVFSVMLGTNDSAEDGPLGSPVSPDEYRRNLAAIMDRLLHDYPRCIIILHRPLWYSSNTYNDSRYLAAGQERLGVWAAVTMDSPAEGNVRSPMRALGA